MGKLFLLYVLLIATLFVSFSYAKKHAKLSAAELEAQADAEAETLAAAEDEKIQADAMRRGALRVGSANVLVPDASAEHPMIISNPEDQPLCKPDVTLTPSRALNIMPGYEIILLANQINNPRKIVIDQANHILVVSPGQGLYSIRMDRCGNSDVQLILNNEKLDQPVGHGFALFDRHIFVATANSVYKFPYSDGQHSPIENGVKVIANINPKDPNAAPDVAIDPFGHAFIPRTVSELHDNVSPKQAMIKKFNLRIIPENGFDYEKDGEVQAYGTNTHGTMGFDTQARLWGINGMSTGEIKRADISVDKDLASSGLAEEINLYEFPRLNYGFPYCMTEYDLKEVSSASKGLGAQWAHPTFMNESFPLDEYCQQEENNRRPAVPLAPNSFATSVFFYMGTFCSVGDLTTQGSSVGLPCNWTDTPIVANHGMTGVAGGHNVVHLHFDDVGHKPRWDKEPDVIVSDAEPCSGSGCFSPYGLATDSFGRLFISSDETNEVFLLSRIYNQNAVKMLTDRDNKVNGDDEPEEKPGNKEKGGGNDDEEGEVEDKDAE